MTSSGGRRGGSCDPQSRLPGVAWRQCSWHSLRAACGGAPRLRQAASNRALSWVTRSALSGRPRPGRDRSAPARRDRLGRRRPGSHSASAGGVASLGRGRTRGRRGPSPSASTRASRRTPRGPAGRRPGGERRPVPRPRRSFQPSAGCRTTAEQHRHTRWRAPLSQSSLRRAREGSFGRCSPGAGRGKGAAERWSAVALGGLWHFVRRRSRRSAGGPVPAGGWCPSSAGVGVRRGEPGSVVAW